LSAICVTGSEKTRGIGHVINIGFYVAARIQFKVVAADNLICFRPGETHSEQHEIGRPFMNGIRNFSHFGAALTIYDKLNIDRFQFGDPIPGTDKLFGQYSPPALTSLFMGRAGTQFHRPEGPGLVRRPILGGFGEKLKISE
jgi:hypothetical protein